MSDTIKPAWLTTSQPATVRTNHCRGHLLNFSGVNQNTEPLFCLIFIYTIPMAPWA